MSRFRSRGGDWLGLGEASRLLGVTPGTLRRWSDDGRLHVFTTPGGHRRFPRSAVERLIRAHPPARRALGAGAVTPARMARAYRREARDAARDLPWLLVLSDEQRLWFREHGRKLAALLLAHLETTEADEREARLNDAAGDAAAYGRMATDLGLSMSQTVEGFLAFRRPFLHELGDVAQRRGFETEEATALLFAAEQAMDRLLVATLTARGTTPGGRRVAKAAGVA